MRLMLPILNFWREAQAHADGSVPGWLSVGTMTLFPPLEPGAQIQSLITRMPAAVRKAEPLFPTIERGQGYVNRRSASTK